MSEPIIYGLDKEIKDKRVVVSQLNDYVNKIRQQLG
jgi:hypothetical protein